jgi:hypothetical protein
MLHPSYSLLKPVAAQKYVGNVYDFAKSDSLVNEWGCNYNLLGSNVLNVMPPTWYGIC